MQTPTESRTRNVVLTGIDLSQGSQLVLQTAAKMAAGTDGELHVIHVLAGERAGSLQGEAALRFANLSDDVRAKLERLATEVKASVPSMTLHVRGGNPPVEIAQLASDIAADVIVVGTHGHNALERLILGSVAENLVRYAPCPVLVCRPKSVRRWEQIAPPCPDCVAVQKNTGRKSLWCERHSQHHPRAHTYSEVPPTFGIGSQTFR